MDTSRKLAVLAEAARFDAPCARRVGASPTPVGRALPVAGDGTGVPGGDPLAEAVRHGICHAMAADGRRIALLKILLTNHCIHDCAYCVNRRSADVERAHFGVPEVVRLT